MTKQSDKLVKLFGNVYVTTKKFGKFYQKFGYIKQIS